MISSSVADTAPVFEKILDSCKHIFDSDETAVLLADEQGVLTLGAYLGKSREAVAATFPAPMGPTPAGRSIRERRVVHYPDVANDETVPRAVRRVARQAGYQSMAYAPMLWNERGIGAIGASRAKGIFNDKELALLQTFADQAVIAIQNARLFNETKEALERQTATGEILASMSGSMTDTQPVFDAITRNLLRLFGTEFAIVALIRDGNIDLAGIQGVPGFEKLAESYPLPLDDSTHVGKTLLAGAVSQLVPIVGNPEAPPRTERFGRDFGFDSQIAAPMVREGKVIGAIVTARRETVPFDNKQIALIMSFADQAVIAIENVRLFNETKEALERQTATAEVLQIISQSPTDVQPVLDAIAERAARLTGADYGVVSRFDDQLVHIVSSFGLDRAGLDALLSAFPMSADGRSITARAVRTRDVVNVSDMLADADLSPQVKQVVQTAGYRSGLAVPMLRDQQVVGAITVNRAATGAFAAKEVKLLQTFADQAVIAIENVRLFNETREALERQTASAEILSVISSSVADTAPVFEKILESCKKLFASAEHGILLIDEHGRARIAAHHGQAGERVTELVASGLADDLLQLEALRNRQPLHFVNTLADDARGPVRRVAQQMGIGPYSQVAAPMVWQERPVGWLYAIRVPATGFSDGEIGLLKTFADQAVIAIQNARLFNETKEALERQTATAEVLQVISGSVADARPVFEKILDSCRRLIPSDGGSVLVVDDQQQVEVGAVHGDRDGMFTRGYPRPIERTVLGLAFDSRRPLYYPEAITAEGVPDVARRFAQKSGFASILVAPMIWEGRRIGCISIARQAAFAYLEKDIDLLQSFADQGVIAIQNARLFRETNEALERQTATAEVLQSDQQFGFRHGAGVRQDPR